MDLMDGYPAGEMKRDFEVAEISGMETGCGSTSCCEGIVMTIPRDDNVALSSDLDVISGNVVGGSLYSK
jgi:hypothetical protein